MEDRVNELEKRVEVLEKDLKRRRTGMIITICAYVALLIAVIVVVVKLYLFIKPIKDKVDAISDYGSQKIDQIKDSFGDSEWFDLFNGWF